MNETIQRILKVVKTTLSGVRVSLGWASWLGAGVIGWVIVSNILIYLGMESKLAVAFPPITFFILMMCYWVGRNEDE